MILMNETLLLGNMKVTIPSYCTWSRNRTEKGGGGIATSVADKFKDSSVGAGQGEDEEEYLITRIECFSPALNIINCYGEQRNTKKEEVERRWEKLRTEMENIRTRKEFCILAGDQNKHVGCGDLGVPGNNPEVSVGGKLMRDLLSTGNWFLVNGLGQEIVQGGPWTRKDPVTGGESCLDLFIISRELLPYVDKLIIDSKREFAVGRALKVGKTYRIVNSDHYTIILNLKDLPTVQNEKKEKRVIWNLAKEGGWAKYKELTEEYSESLERAIEQGETIEEKMFKFNKVHEKIKFMAFGKITLGSKPKEEKTLNKNKKKDDQEDEAKSLFEEEVKRTSEEIEELKKMKKSKVGTIWEIKKRIVGGKKANIEATAIVNPKDGKLAVTKKQIKAVTLNYCKETLTNNEPSEGYKHIMKAKKDSLEKHLQENRGSFSPTKEAFEAVINKFKISRKPNYHFLVRASGDFKNVVFRFAQMMIEKEVFPNCFKETTLHMIFKGGKGRRQNLSDNRFVHSKFWFPRLVEGLIVVEGLKKPLIEGSSMYQIGGQPGHRAEELIFAMKSVIARYRSQGKCVLLQTSDLSKFFDKEMIEDAILTSYKRGADPKACRLWYKINEGTLIRVKTGAGLSKFIDAGAVVGQGTLGGALVSQAVLDEGISEQFAPGGEDEMIYGSVPMAPVIFQDDILHAAEGIKEARIANARMDRVVKRLNLTLNKDKTFCISMGSKSQRAKIKAELEKNPLKCGDIETELKESFKWLGQILSSGGLSESVNATVQSREGKIRGACLEISQIVNDWRSQVVGGIETALLLWEACCIPSLLNGAGTWTEISKATEKKLNQIQYWGLRLFLQVGPGTPLVSLLWDSGALEMSLRIKVEKIMLILHIRSLGPDSLANKIYVEQRTHNWPGLAKETKQICEDLELEDCNTTLQERNSYKTLLMAACHRSNEKSLRLLARGKCERIGMEEYGRKEYFRSKNIFNVRQQYRTRFGLLPFGGNYSHDRRFANSNWLCKCQEAREEECHLISGQCKVYGDLTDKYTDLTDDNNLVQLFQEVLARRDQLDRALLHPVGGANTNVGANLINIDGIRQFRD